MSASYAVAPGMYLQEWIEEVSVTQQEAADRLGLSRKTVNGIIKGTQPVSQETAIKLERVTSIPRDAWLRFEAKYREDLARLEDENNLASSASIIPSELASFMRAHGATAATKRNPGKLVSDFLAMVGFGSVEAYELGVANILSSVATLKESGKQVDPASMMAWIALGKEAESAMADELVAYEPDALKASLAELRARAETTDQDTLRDIAQILARSGVILQFVEAPDKFPLHGVTRWTADGNPVIQLTGRRKKDGYIIWTLFHELGHILNDGNTGMTVNFIEGRGARAPKSDAEKHANAFAKEALLGPGGLAPYHGLSDSASIKATAQARGACPGVVVNLMHRNRTLDYKWCNDLLVDMDIPFVG